LLKTVVACRSTIVYVDLRLPNRTGVAPGKQSGIWLATTIGKRGPGLPSTSA